MSEETRPGEEPGVDLDGLPREAVPPPALEERLVRELRARGMLRGRRAASTRRVAAAIAAGVALFAAGLVAGRALPERALPGRAPHAADTFVLLLYRGAEPEGTPAELEQRVGEVIGWVRGVRASGRVLHGEKLGEDARKLGAPEVTATGASELQGFFVLEAASLAEAEDVARTCPHLKHGGVIVVKKVERT